MSRAPVQPSDRPEVTPARASRIRVSPALKRGLLRVTGHRDDDTVYGAVCRGLARVLEGFGDDSLEAVWSGLNEIQRTLRQLGHQALEELEARDATLGIAPQIGNTVPPCAPRGPWYVIDRDGPALPAEDLTGDVYGMPPEGPELPDLIDGYPDLSLPPLEYLEELDQRIEAVIQRGNRT